MGQQTDEKHQESLETIEVFGDESVINLEEREKSSKATPLGFIDPTKTEFDLGSTELIDAESMRTDVDAIDTEENNPVERQTPDAFCSWCSSAFDISEENTELYQPFRQRVEDVVTECESVLNITEQNDGSVLVALARQNLIETNDLEVTLSTDDLVQSVEVVDSGLLVESVWWKGACPHCDSENVINREHDISCEASSQRLQLELLKSMVDESTVDLFESIVQNADDLENVLNERSKLDGVTDKFTDGNRADQKVEEYAPLNLKGESPVESRLKQSNDKDEELFRMTAEKSERFTTILGNDES